ncbi:MAG: peptidylprolyl isomerase [bacterium]
MKRNFKMMGVACASLFLLTGCGEIPQLQNGQDAVVSFEGIDGISVETLYNDLKLNYGLNTLLTLIDKQVYEAEFPDHMEDAKEYATSYLESMISYYGSEEDLLAQLTGSFASLDSYENYLYVAYLQNIAIEDYSKSLITDKQVQKYYDEEYYADVTLSHILITSDASSTATDEEVEEASLEAKATAKEVIDLLKEAKANGDDIEEVFAELALEYSDDAGSKSDGGLFGTLNYEDLDSTYDELIASAITLKDGEFSTVVIETELGFHVILKNETLEKKSLEDATDLITEVLSTNALSTDSTIILEGLAHFREKYGFSIHDEDLEDEYSQYMKDLEKQVLGY